MMLCPRRSGTRRNRGELTTAIVDRGRVYFRAERFARGSGNPTAPGSWARRSIIEAYVLIGEQTCARPTESNQVNKKIKSRAVG